MKKIIIPEDLKKIGKKKKLSCVIIFEVLLLCSALILYFAKDWLNSISFENKVITYIFIFALPFVLSGFPRKLMDKTWSGRVVKAELRRVSVKDYYSRFNFSRKWMPVVDIIKDKDDFVSETTTNVKLTENGDLDMYSKGTKVVHVYGCDYLYVMPEKSTDPVVCVVCGMKNYNEEDNAGNRGSCKCCGHSLDIRFEDNKVGRYYH